MGHTSTPATVPPSLTLTWATEKPIRPLVTAGGTGAAGGALQLPPHVLQRPGRAPDTSPTAHQPEPQPLARLAAPCRGGGG